MSAVVLDTGREMRGLFTPLLRAARRLSVELWAAGDHRCHLLQHGARPHLCGLERSYELALYHFARLRPLRRGTLLLCGNGLLRDAVSSGHVRRLGGEEREHVYTDDLLRELRQRVKVRMLYVSRGIYDVGAWHWQRLLGTRDVAVLEQGGDAAAAMRRLIGHA